MIDYKKDWFYCNPPMTIPTIFEEEISYLKRQDYLYHKINEICEYLKHCQDKPTPVIPPTGKVEKNLVTDSYLSHYARKVEVGYYPQGMCIAKINEDDYVVQCFIKADNSAQIIDIIGVSDGNVRAREEFTTLGHANDICTDGSYLYVATGGGNSTVYSIVKIDFNLNIVETFSYSKNINPYAIGYNKGLFYILGANSQVFVTKNLENISESYTLPLRKNAIGQSVCVDDNYVFVPRGNWYSNYSANQSCLNIVDVFTHKIELVKTIYLHTGAEVEGFDFLEDGTVLFAQNTISSAVYDKGLIYEGLYDGPNDNSRYLFPFVVRQWSVNYYVDETYSGFIQDGSEQYPFTSIWQPLVNEFANINTFIITLKSDISPGTITFARLPLCRLRINGNNHIINGSIIVNNGSGIHLNQVTINPTESYAMDINFALSCYFSNVTFNVQNSNGVRCQGTAVQFENCIFNNPNNTVNLYAIGGSLRLLTGFTENSGYSLFPTNVYFDGPVARGNNSLNTVGASEFSAQNKCIVYYNDNVNKMLYPGFYKNFSSEGLPAGHTWTSLEVKRLNETYEQQILISTDNYVYSRLVTVNVGEAPTAYSDWLEHVAT